MISRRSSSGISKYVSKSCIGSACMRPPTGRYTASGSSAGPMTCSVNSVCSTSALGAGAGAADAAMAAGDHVGRAGAAGGFEIGIDVVVFVGHVDQGLAGLDCGVGMVAAGSCGGRGWLQAAGP